MQYIIDGEFYKITRVTGPKHNMLGVRFSDTHKEMEVVDLDFSAKQVNFSASEVKSQVQLGLADVNRELGTKYKISAIQFVGSDTKSDSIYAELVKIIVRRLESGCKFMQA